MCVTKSLLCGSLRTPISQKARWVGDKKGICRIVAYKQTISQDELLSSTQKAKHLNFEVFWNWVLTVLSTVYADFGFLQHIYPAAQISSFLPL